MKRERIIELAGEVMDKLDFVQWDRYVDVWKQEKILKFYGWIPRIHDLYKDFVILEYQGEMMTYTTSSEKYSSIIANKLGFSGEISCTRIEDLFPAKKNVIKLSR